MYNCLQIQTGLIKKKTIFVCGIDLNRRKELVTLSLGTAALITRDKALIASENPPFDLPKKALTPINQGDALVKAKVHRESRAGAITMILGMVELAE
jgi:hypothetical protein